MKKLLPFKSKLREVGDSTGLIVHANILKGENIPAGAKDLVHVEVYDSTEWAVSDSVRWPSSNHVFFEDLIKVPVFEA